MSHESFADLDLQYSQDFSLMPFASATAPALPADHHILTSPVRSMPTDTPRSWSSNTSPLPMLSWSSSECSPSTQSSPAFTTPLIGRQKRHKSPALVVHPYARLEAKKNQLEHGVKRRKVWDHLLERRIFTPEELVRIKAQDRRKVYISSLEAHVDVLHAQLLSYSLYPVPFERLEKMSGLHSKTAMAMISGVLQDTQEIRIKLLELERSTQNLRVRLKDREQETPMMYYPG